MHTLKILPAVCLLFISFTARSQSLTNEHRISVIGEGVVKAIPDQAWMTFGVETSGSTPQEATSRNDKIMRAALDIAHDRGITGSDIQTTMTMLEPRYNYRGRPQTIDGYVMRKMFRMRVKDLTVIDAIMTDQTKAGVNVTQQVEFSSSKIAEHKSEALNLAVADAKSKAETLVKATALTLGGVVRIQEQPYGSVRPLYRGYLGNATTETTQAATYEPGSIEIRTQVQVDYELK
jgi:uncharacterized protein YggE